MKIAYMLLAILVILLPAYAQEHSKEPPPQGTNGKTMESCRPDVRKYCERANLTQECLVAHWTRISSDCQEALAAPIRDGGD